MVAKTAGSFFVPHDLEAPIEGAHGGPLAGLSAVVKDMYDIVGARTGGGNPEWLAAQKPATVHAAAVGNILDAGATIVGKTVCDEFFYSVTGENAHYGTPLNVRAPGRVPGGSSAGSAAATGAGVCDFALGSDTGGSIRVPASFCGIYGLRPTHGRIDLSGAMPMAPSFDTGGWFASSPGVFRKVGSVLLEGSGDNVAFRELLIADDAFAEADPDVASLLTGVLARAKDALPQAKQIRVAPEGLDAWREAFRIVQAWETWRSYGAFIERHKPRLGPGVRERMEFAASVTAADADASRKKCAAARDAGARAGAARHNRRAACRANHRPACEPAGWRTRPISPAHVPLDLHLRALRPAAGGDSRGHRLRLPDRAFLHWSGAVRRSPSRPCRAARALPGRDDIGPHADCAASWHGSGFARGFGVERRRRTLAAICRTTCHAVRFNGRKAVLGNACG